MDEPVYGGGSRQSMSDTPKVYIVLVNWNGWRDTILCLESVLRLGYRNFTVVVCDNASHDGSLEHIQRWCQGELAAEGGIPELARLTSPRVPKPVPYVLLGREQAERGDGPASRVVLVQTGHNLGFAGGNNVGFRYALARGDAGYVWALNNDTVVRSDALAALVTRMEDDAAVGLCGSTVLYMSEPTVVQAYGGASYQPWTTAVSHIGMGESFRLLREGEVRAIEGRLSYVLGASMLASRRFLEAVGLMQDDYFLFFEEIDWAERARQHGFRLGYAAASVVYHQAGAATGSKKETPFSLYLLNRNRLRFIARFYRGFLAINYLALWIDVAKALVKGRWQKARAVACALLGIPLFKLPEPPKDGTGTSH